MLGHHLVPDSPPFSGLGSPARAQHPGSEGLLSPIPLARGREQSPLDVSAGWHPNSSNW